MYAFMHVHTCGVTAEMGYLRGRGIQVEKGEGQEEGNRGTSVTKEQ